MNTENQLNDHQSRSHAVRSASSSKRWLACPASALLAEKYPKQDTVFTREGTVAHEVAEAVMDGRAVTAGGYVTDEMITHAEAYRDYIQSLCTDDTSVMLEVRVDFSPWVADGFGTADCILLHGSVMDVIDYKYGKGVAVDAEENSQMQLYGLGALNEYGYVFDIETVRLHIFQPRLDSISVWETSRAELLAFGEYVKERALDDSSMAAGEHCRFCPHAGKCPELAVHCIQFLRTGNGDTLCGSEELTPEATARVLGMESTIKSWLTAVKASALASAIRGEEIPGYKVVPGRMGNREWTDEGKVMEALQALGYTVADYAPPKLLSPAGIDKLMGKKKAELELSGYIHREPGSPTLAPVKDKREKYSEKKAILDIFDELQ